MRKRGGRVLKGAFLGGIHPPEMKHLSAGSAIERAPVPERLVVPLVQHLGAPCQPMVEAGQRVRRGEVIGSVDALVSAPVHSPVDGEVVSVGECLTAAGTRAACVTIAPYEDQDFEQWVRVEGRDVPSIVRAAGIVGLGGAAFPTAVKLVPPKDLEVSTVILNGCECEPYLTCDHRLMLESPDLVVRGASILRTTLGAARVVVGVEANKPDAAEALRKASDGTDVEVLVLPTKYPQGAEKQLIWAVLRKEVPHGKLPAAAGALVHNVGTAAAIAEAIDLQKPLMERIVTVTGRVARPGNYRVLLGTLVSDLIRAAGGFAGEVARVVAGGPMTGPALGSLDVPVTKGMSGVVVLGPDDAAPPVDGDQPCIRCGRCSEACPMFLQPFAIGTYANAHLWDRAGEFHALDCIECGACAYVCPTRRPLVQLIRLAKGALLAKGVKP
ncbi:MAG: electron transport complex subunit RsxC [Coriobacteriia bacterium]|nr:electron transport complex subunit RsxC [Coriobacteriia bacterium]